MSKNSPSARRHRALVFLAHPVDYHTYGPLVGPKEAHQPETLEQWRLRACGGLEETRP